MAEPVDPIDTYDSEHGNPSATPDAPKLSEEEAWGAGLNPVRETPMPAKGLKSV